MRARAGTAALLAFLSAGCGAGAPTEPAAAGESLAERLATPHFRIHAGFASDAVVREIAESLEGEFARVTAELNVSGLRPMRVLVWQDEAAFGAEMQRYFGQRFASNGYVTGPEELRLLAVAPVARNAVHEFCHAASLYVNPSLGNNPRWLWETVALYENGERVDPRSLAYLVRGDFPTLQALDADPNASRQVYEVGYLLGEYVVERFGRDGLLRLIRANGDTAAALGLTTPAFEAGWRGFVRERYLP